MGWDTEQGVKWGAEWWVWGEWGAQDGGIWGTWRGVLGHTVWGHRVKAEWEMGGRMVGMGCTVG